MTSYKQFTLQDLEVAIKSIKQNPVMYLSPKMKSDIYQSILQTIKQFKI